jgi:hypothetical protein
MDKAKKLIKIDKAERIWNRYANLLRKMKTEKTFSQKERIEFEYLQEIVENTIN